MRHLNTQILIFLTYMQADSIFPPPLSFPSKLQERE